MPCSMATRPVDPLLVGRVIGDVVDMFVPAAELTVHYGSRHVANGSDVKPSTAADKPRVHISGFSRVSDHLYTLVMVDPDAPSPSQPTLREWLHWIVTDIPEGSDASEGNEVVPYMGPSPPTGIHRYVFAIFKQKRRLGMAAKPPEFETRNNFNTRRYASEHDLGLPVAALYFNSQKEPFHKKR